MVGCVLWEELLWSGQMHLFFLICLRGFWLFLAHPANTRSHLCGACVEVASALVAHCCCELLRG